MGNLGRGEGGAVREQTPTIISSRLSRLDDMIRFLETDLEELRGEISPPVTEIDKKVAAPSFNQVYQILPDSLKQFADRLGKFRDELRAMLL